MKDAKVRDECRRLRIEERLSSAEIVRRTGVSKSTLSGWLKDIPLTDAEARAIASNAHKGKLGRKKERGEKSKFFEMVDVKSLTRLDKAKIAEAAVLFRLCLNRFVVYGSPFDGDKADWLVESLDEKGRTYRIQVRWTKEGRPGNGLPFVSLLCVEKGKMRRYKKGEFDFIVGYCLFNDTAYVYSFDDVAHLKATVSISGEAAEAWHKMRPR